MCNNTHLLLEFNFDGVAYLHRDMFRCVDRPAVWRLQLAYNPLTILPPVSILRSKRR